MKDDEEYGWVTWEGEEEKKQAIFPLLPGGVCADEALENDRPDGVPPDGYAAAGGLHDAVCQRGVNGCKFFFICCCFTPKQATQGQRDSKKKKAATRRSLKVGQTKNIKEHIDAC